MSSNPAEMLKLFYAIQPARIEHDLLAARGKFVEMSTRLKASRKDWKDRTPVDDAETAHWSMVQAHELARVSHVPEEFRLLYASQGVETLVQAAQMAASKKGRLAELWAQMDAIKRREGLRDGEFWYRGEAPAEHEALDEESEKIFECIEDTIIVHALRRYKLAEFADLFERDRAEYEIQREIGRRAMFGNLSGAPEIDARMDGLFAEDYGTAALARIRKRVAELRGAGAQ